MRIVTERGPRTAADTPAAVALGLFDGVHLGHRAVIEAARDFATKKGLRLAVFTFPPVKNAGTRICTQAQKHALLEALGVDTCYEPPFGRFHTLSPEAFFEQMLLGQYSAKALSCGENFHFGAGAAGDVPLLEKLCAQNDVALAALPMAMYHDKPISSSRIRRALAEGRMPDANAMLGRPYAILATVRHGQQLGRTLGFPTINQTFEPGLVTPAFGVYATRTRIDGAWHNSVTGWGTRPTVANTEAVCETFIPGFEGDLYGREIEVRFYAKIADERKFAGKAELAAAVREWAGEAQAVLENGQLNHL